MTRFDQDQSNNDTLPPETQKPYVTPRIIHELDLETRAGSSLSIPDPLDPTGINPGTSE